MSTTCHRVLKHVLQCYDIFRLSQSCRMYDLGDTIHAVVVSQADRMR